ncbi:MAG: patatin-like phospholipase family protein [Syntrophobacterales bacterium]|jgi:NTE family protein
MKTRKSKPLNGILPRPLAFVFSGGTSLGSVQVGMLKAVFEAGIKPDLLVGTSAGAVNAASVGQGFTESHLENLATIWGNLKTSDVFGRFGIRNVLGLLNGRGALASAEGLRGILRTHLPSLHSDLAISTAIVATEFLSGSPAILSEGDLVRNVLASTAIPMIFPSVTVDNRQLVDGGIVAHVPLAQAEMLGGSTLVVFDAGYPCKLSRSPRGSIERAIHFLTLMLHRQSFGLLSGLHGNITVIYLPAPCPLDVPAYDFSQGSRLISAGFKSASSFLSKLSVTGPGIYGNPHLHDDPMHAPVEVGSGSDFRF